MKKVFKSILAASLCILMIFACAACSGGSGSGDNGIVGTWKLQIDNAALPSMSEQEASATQAYLSTLNFSITFNADGTATASGSLVSGSQSGTVKWTQSGNTITLASTDASNSGSMTLTLKDGKLWFDAATVGEQAASMMYLAK